jgi:type II secretory pathway predicted ATPase ExeA
MLTEVMRFYGLARPPIDAGFFETEHHAQVSRDIRAAIVDGRLIALTAITGSGKTILSRRLRTDLEREGRVIVSRSLSVDKAKITVPLLLAALFYDLTPDKAVTISSQSERRERDLQELFRRAKKPVALFIDDAHDLHPKTLVALKRLIELVVEGGGQLSIVLVGHPKLKNDLRRPKMEEIGDRTTVFEFGGLRDRQRDYIDWVLKASLDECVAPGDIVTDQPGMNLGFTSFADAGAPPEGYVGPRIILSEVVQWYDSSTFRDANGDKLPGRLRHQLLRL